MYPFIENKSITDLGFGGGFALWRFRAIASSKMTCRHFTAGFNRAFSIDNDDVKSQHGGTSGRLAMNALKSFSYQLEALGKRKIILSSSGTLNVTADELSIVAALAAAQAGRDDVCHLHLTWFLAHSDTTYAKHAAMTYGIICAKAGINIESLDIEAGQAPSEERHIKNASQAIGA